jgi:carbon-monoxide dehydrogenase large subunit
MKQFGFGQPVRRTEDPRLLTGHGRYIDDIALPGQARAAFVRSAEAHARLKTIDVSAAAAAPGVIGVVTGADLKADGIGPIPCRVRLRSRDGSRMVMTERMALATDRVRHVGEAVALVIAETPEQAADAAERVEIDSEPLPAVADAAQALAEGAPQLWDDVPGNLAFDWEHGDREATEAAFAKAAHVVGLDLVNNRCVANPLEGRGCVASHDPATGKLTLQVSCQGVHDLRDMLAEDIFRLPADKVHVMCGDVGGGFGLKIFMYPEYVATLYAARRFGRPVKWIAERGEGFVSDNHGRDRVVRAELALDADARILALRSDGVANLGGYLSNYGPAIHTLAGVRVMPGLYRMEAIHVRVRGAYTNTQATDAYRGAGRPEATYQIERLVDAAARQLGISPVEIRRRNLIPAEALPYKTVTGLEYDSGDFVRNLDDVLALSGWESFPERRKAAEARGRLRGIGLSTYVEISAGFGTESPTIRLGRDGRVTALVGTQSNGQGHETAFAQLVAETLGLAPEAVTMVQGDTELIAEGEGTDGSRSIPIGGAALADAAAKLRDKARARAAELLQAPGEDLAFEDGRFTVAGSNRNITLQEIAAAAEGEIAFEESGFFKPSAGTFPNGAHVCEVEIDPETGAVAVVNYSVVDDVGRVLNPLMLEGQVHGGVAQGIGQALMEHAVFDPESGQLVTGSFMDYAMPHARSVPLLTVRTNEFPCRTNPLGVKGAGEAGAIAAPPTVINAVVDALVAFGVEHVDMPARPETIWRLCRRGRRPAAA